MPLQHNLYSWAVLGNDFVYEDTLTTASRYLDSTLKEWLGHMSITKREAFVEAIYAILSTTKAETLNQLTDNLLPNSKTVLQAMRGMDEDTKATISDGISLFLKSAWKHFRTLRE